MPGVGVGGFVERVGGIEVDADQGQEPASLAVPGPQDLVVPVRILPADALFRVKPPERREEPGFQPLSVAMEQRPGAVGMDLFHDLTDRVPDNQPGDQQADQQHHPAEHPSHGHTPGP